MGHARRRKTPQTAAKRARGRDYGDRRRQAALREAYPELAEQLRPVADVGAHPGVELMLRMAADGAESALRTLRQCECLNAVGVDHVDELDEAKWDAVAATHAGRTTRSAPSVGQRAVSA